eukprot:TRINITY_DN24137_c0_g1_i1.p1 TRINITY_DN24137_c0_g1~~TRINITY_DN24137_c0_g1_i1.p1  ORF type:complete len:617 (+),score=121.41 TRINITY_DN24137_c0_g1_i1:106-1956(+)
MLAEQLERRRREQFEKFANALAEVDAYEFMEEVTLQPGVAMALDLGVNGTIPPLTSSRQSDVGAARSIVTSERAAAEELIARSRKEGLEANKASAARVRRQRCQSRAASRGSEATTRPSSGVPSELQSPRSASSCKAASMRSTPTPMPSATPFERSIADFYREEERRRVDERATAEKARRHAEQEERQAKVHRDYFELQHRRREQAIASELVRRERRHRFDASQRADIWEALAAQEEQRKLELRQKRESVLQQRETHKAKVNHHRNHRSFVLRATTLDKACRKTDKIALREREQLEADADVDYIKDIWAQQASHLQNRRNLVKAQKRLRDQDHERRMKYELKLAREQEHERVATRKQQIQAQHSIEAAKHSMQRHLLRPTDVMGTYDLEAMSRHHGSVSSAGFMSKQWSGEAAAEVAAPEEYENYQTVLSSFADMANEVQAVVRNATREHQTSLELQDKDESTWTHEYGDDDVDEDGPLYPVEPRIRSALSGATTPVESEEVKMPWTEKLGASDELAFAQAAPQLNIPNLRDLSLSMSASSQHLVSVNLEPQEPLSAQAPFTTRKLLSLTDQVSLVNDYALYPATPRGVLSAREGPSLSALRRVRQTGPPHKLVPV